ncbi:MAG: hypothetical protein GX195_05340 [Firmicutes bacterium]|nr:hypothetical protein [Bacillota bacterium]
MEKHNYVIPSDYEIETALAEGTAGHYSADDMWRTISSELEAAPHPWLLVRRSWLALGGAAAILCLVMVLNWSSLFPGSTPSPAEEPQIMRFAAFAPVTAAVRVEDEELAIQLTAADDVQFGSGPALIRILKPDHSEVERTTSTELAQMHLARGETRTIHAAPAGPLAPGEYQVHLQLELKTADGSQTLDVFQPFTIPGKD